MGSCRMTRVVVLHLVALPLLISNVGVVQPAQLPVPIHIRTWLDNPTNVNKLWSMAKRIINDLPPPRNVGDLARVLDRLFAIIRLRLQLIMELYRGKANPTIYRGLAAMGSQPREAVLR